MKKTFFSSLGKLSVLALSLVLMGVFSSKTFATYTSFMPSGCPTGNVYIGPIPPGGGELDPNQIFVIPAGTYNVTGNIVMNSCSVLTTSGHVVINFISGHSIVSNNKQKISIRGFNENNRLEIINGTNSPGAIMLQNSSGATISYTSISGFTILGGIAFDHTTNSTISNNIITNNKDGIRLMGGSNNNIISGNYIDNNTQYGILLDGVFGCTGDNNTISNSTMGIYLQSSYNNFFINNTGTANVIGVALDSSNTNTFTSNKINSNSAYGLSIGNSSSGNIFTSNIISGNINTNLFIFNSSNYNNFTNNNIQYATIGIQIDSSNYNVFSGVNVANNNSGIVITPPSNNNTITGGIFFGSTTSNTSHFIPFLTTTSTTVNITGNGLSGDYVNIPASGITGTTIVFDSVNEIKNIIVTYTGNNKQYDSITLGTVPPPPPQGPGGGIVTCTTSQLICSGGIRVLAPGQYCQGGTLGQSCSVTTGGTTGALPIGSIVGSPFSTELNQAYLRAYAQGITTMNTIQKSNMTGYLIRSHMAKMISVFAIMLGERVPDTSAKCTFTDIANQSTEMKFYINLACQLGLMGQGIQKFSPHDVVTRAQFGTIMSRVIWGNTYEGGTKYYTNHLNALKNAGIMTKIDTPTAAEMRGWVMLMMKRTYEGGFLNN